MAFSTLLALCPARASQKLEGVRSIIAYDSQAVVNRGGEIDIPLDAIPNYGNTIHFEIQTLPLHGVLSSPVNQSDHTAILTYRHDGSSDPIEDSFTFRAASVGRAKSVSYQVRISVKPRPAHLSFVPPVLDFGEVILSESSLRQVTLTNSGGSRMICKLVFPRGFSALESDSVTLDEGQSTNISVVFSPKELGHLSGVANLVPSTVADSFLVQGVGIPRFKVLKCSPTEWKIINLSTNPIIINASGGQGWEVPSEVKIPAKLTQVMRFQQLAKEGYPQDHLNLNTRFQISDGLSACEVELPQPKQFVPLNLQQVSPLDSGSILLGNSIPITLRVQNRTDLTRQVTWEAFSSSGGGLAEPQFIQLRGGEVKEITHIWKPAIPGDAILQISVLERGAPSVKMTFKTKVVGAASSEKNTSGSDLSIAENQASSIAVNDSLNGITTQIPIVEGVSSGIEKNWYGKSIPYVSWKSLTNQESRMIVEELIPVISQDTITHHQLMNMISKSLNAAQRIRKNDHDFLLLGEFAPGYHLVRLMIVSKDPKVPDAISQLMISVPATQSWWSLFETPFYLLILVMLLLLFKRLRRST